MKTVPNNQGPKQPQLVYYEPDHDARVSDILAGVLALRGYKLTSDPTLLDGPGLAVLRDGDGVLSITDGTRTEALAEVETFMIPQSYAHSIANWFDTTPVFPLVCVLDGCGKAARPASRFCSVEHNAASAYRAGARW